MHTLPIKLMLSLMLIPVLVCAEKIKAEDIYVKSCYVCHGENASGNMPGVPDLANNERLFTDREDNIVERIKTGIQTPGNIAMPPNGGNPDLTDEELLSVLRYVKKIANSD